MAKKNSPRKRRRTCARRTRPPVCAQRDPKCARTVGARTHLTPSTCHQLRRQGPSMFFATDWRCESGGSCVGGIIRSSTCCNKVKNKYINKSVKKSWIIDTGKNGKKHGGSMASVFIFYFSSRHLTGIRLRLPWLRELKKMKKWSIMAPSRM